MDNIRAEAKYRENLGWFAVEIFINGVLQYSLPFDIPEHAKAIAKRTNTDAEKIVREVLKLSNTGGINDYGAKTALNEVLKRLEGK